MYRRSGVFQRLEVAEVCLGLRGGMPRIADVNSESRVRGIG